MGDEVSWATRTLLQESWRGVADDFPDFNVTVFQAYSFYVDQLGTIEGMTINNVVTTLIIMALVCLLLIPNPTSVISATAAMISINIGVFGFLFAWDTDLDPITMITITMSIGYSVDFTAHISYHFYRNDATWSNEKRLAHALASIGFPMMQAGTSCFLGVVPLMLVNSYMVYVFIKTIFLVIVLGLIHGLLFLPALLLSIGKIDTWCKKKCIKSAEEHSCAPVENVITLPDISMQIVPMGPPFNTTDSASTERDDESTRTVQQMAFVATPSFQEARDNKSGLSAQRSL
uniref:Patched domain containing 3 n=1 Tax=Plectus sambesii TaxID=2011161 RepID=A0A914W6M3_9BILA